MHTILLYLLGCRGTYWECEEAVDDAVSATHTMGVPTTSSDLDVYGVASTEADVAIVSVSVGGLPADPTEGDLRLWKVVVPFSFMETQADATRVARLPIFARDLCGNTQVDPCASDATQASDAATCLEVVLQEPTTEVVETDGSTNDTGGTDTGGTDTGPVPPPLTP